MISFSLSFILSKNKERARSNYLYFVVAIKAINKWFRR